MAVETLCCFEASFSLSRLTGPQVTLTRCWWRSDLSYRLMGSSMVSHSSSPVGTLRDLDR